ncbi:unnamed protein product [Urochloa decumbens]|uniref:Bifunctional inhibitor/plant lipid transfer protein/seed storage helical domain-containing protein n=1 Tax=Urochloa decumbens TaxID=240449 RepID=A0ABC8WG06_9POAL
MAKLIAAALCLAALVAVAAGQSAYERQRLRDLWCQREVEESPLEACRQVLDRQLSMRYGVRPFLWGTGLRMRCCQQLQDVSRECRCSAVRAMVRAFEEETMPPPEEGYGGYGSGEQGGEGYYGGESGQRYLPFPVGPGKRIGRVRLTKARDYAAGLPMMCRLEPQECSIFSGDQYKK